MARGEKPKQVLDFIEFSPKIDDKTKPDPEEAFEKEYEASYKEWESALEKAIAAGDDRLVEELREMGK